MELSQEQTTRKHDPEYSNKEQQPLLELSGTVDAIGNVIKELDGTNLTPEQQSRLRKIKGKIIKSTGKFLGVMRGVAVTGAILGSIGLGGGAGLVAIGHEINSHALEETTDASGQTIYTHPDELTTHYLNILAGRDKFTDKDLELAHENNKTAKDLNILAGTEKFTDEDVERIGRRFFKGILITSGLPLPANIEEMSSLEIETLMLKNPEINRYPERAESMAQNSVTQFAQETTRRLNERAEVRFSTDRDMYGLVWQLEKEGGNPRIRLKAEGGTVFGLASSREGYSAVRNTMYVDVDSLADGSGIVVEMSHGKQFEGNLLGSSLRNARDIISIILKSGFGVRGWQKEYDKLYQEPGSIEYEAHKVIQPDLENRYPISPYFKRQQKDGESK